MNINELTHQDFLVDTLGDNKYDSPLNAERNSFINDDNRILLTSYLSDVKKCAIAGRDPLSFENAGPRRQNFFDASKVICAVVTCGGLCPGLNDVIRSIVYESYDRYGVDKVYGFRYGYKGMVKKNNIEPIVLDRDIVNDIHEKGGTILGSSRGKQNISEMVDYLVELGISILYTIGGDGTLRGAGEIAEEISKRNLPISVIGIPKTIDNDILFVKKTFGFETAVEESRSAIQSAHIEARGTEHGVGLVKLMGRDSGFIAAGATLANTDVNFCLVPECEFSLDKLLDCLVARLKRRKHAVIVVAEGAGQYLLKGSGKKDASGNILHEDIGVFLRDKIKQHLKEIGLNSSVKYIDPSYLIRSKAANANDSLFCLQLGQNAVHAGMAGRTNMLVGYWNRSYTHVPLSLVVGRRKKLVKQGRLWQTVLAITDNP